MSTQHHIHDTIELTEVEEKIFNKLRETLRDFQLQTQPRVARGWVRDKLLRKYCYNIDIALDDMMCSEFVEKVRDYLLFIKEDAPSVCVIVRGYLSLIQLCNNIVS